MGRQLTLRQKIEERIKNHVDDVFLPREFSDLSDEDQVLRALRNLVREGSLVKLGYGVYGRAVKSQLTGQAILYSQNGFAGDDAVDDLGGAVKDVRAVTGHGLVGVEWVGGMVRVGNQIDGGGIGHQLDVGLAAHGGGEGLDDTPPSTIADMQNPPARMGGFLAAG